ncbi:putative galactose-3-O-sulfotransferase 3-like [Triplophysa rosa]|uniref:Galactose-3-O-sulfotransferase 3-like n=1 Tax=Triplophysa rosa TaxID=992332 RepID=A0A9W7WKQ0_TRIRA|nr:putative galactose-3-O-sulfotransferase 3-like [Triplophysa rosa]
MAHASTRFRAGVVDYLPEGSSQFDLLCSHMRLDLTQGSSVRKDPPLTPPTKTNQHLLCFWSLRSASGTQRNGPAKNPMSSDIGLNNQKRNSSWPEDLDQLEEAFHLVMIAKHFDESLVLMGALLRLEREDFRQLDGDRRDHEAKLRSWNTLDTLLYDFFLQVIWEKVDQFGQERLNAEVVKLRTSTENIQQKCVSRAAVPPAELEDLVRPGNLSIEDEEFCVRMMLPELQYHSH